MHQPQIRTSFTLHSRQQRQNVSLQRDQGHQGHQVRYCPADYWRTRSFGPQTFTVTNPASGEEIWEAAGASVKEATQAVEAAAAAFPAWSKAKPAVRRDIFLKASQLFDERYEEFKGYQAAETSADPMFMHWILKSIVDNMKELAGKCSMVQGSILFSADEGRSALVLREPYGVVVGIAPWYISFQGDEFSH